jgi:HflK protein
VRATGDIGLFAVVAEAGVAAGVRRIEAITGMESVKAFQRERDALSSLAATLNTRPAEIAVKVAALQEDNKRLGRELQQAKMKAALGGNSSGSAPESVDVAGVKSTSYKSRVLTAEPNMVELQVAVQYRIKNAEDYLFKVRDPVATLSEVSESAIRQVVGQSVLDDVLVGKTRPNITRRTKELIQATLDRYDTGIQVSTVNLVDVQVPDPVIPSQRDMNKALADQERFVKEAQAYANQILPVAEGAAARLGQDAQAYSAQVVALATGQASRFSQLAAAYDLAPEVTRKRLYLDTVENVTKRVANRGQLENGEIVAAAREQHQRKYVDPNGIKFDIVNAMHARNSWKLAE